MSSKVRWYSYVLALILGLAVVFLITPLLRAHGAALFRRLIVFWAICGSVGVFLGSIWPAKGWRWGFWLGGPFWILSILSLLFAGGLRLFMLKDLAILAITTIVECGGAYMGARLRD